MFRNNTKLRSIKYWISPIFKAYLPEEVRHHKTISTHMYTLCKRAVVKVSFTYNSFLSELWPFNFFFGFSLMLFFILMSSTWKRSTVLNLTRIDHCSDRKSVFFFIEIIKSDFNYLRTLHAALLEIFLSYMGMIE